ncbi:phage tail spike protein [Enterococcus sp. AZ103]|uniref:phage tail protein n=1 Tax=Enterococcus sp. AZ103 TaxID=2774628 RepID=UPI003F247115
MLMTMNLNREYTAILENASDVSYEKSENQIGSISFKMPLFDSKNSMIQALQYVELTDNEDEYIGLYRIMPSTIQKDKSNHTITYEATHVLGTLLDSVLFGYHEMVNRPTLTVINYVLSQQKVKHWILKKCEFTRYFSYSWENENGLADALFSIPKAFDEDYLWEWDTQVYPFELSLVKPQTEPVCRLQEGYNLVGYEVESNPNDTVNRIYPLGAGEGVNQLNIKSVNNNIAYVEDKTSIAKYGLVEYVWVDQRFTDAQSLKNNAEAMLKKWSIPSVSWKTTAVDLTKLTDEPIQIDLLRQGNVVMLNTDDYGSINFRIKKESKADVFGNPQDIKLELGTTTGDISTTLSDLARKQQINETYSQGATNILNYSYQDNCEAAYPAEIEFYIDDDVFNINTVELTFKTKRYRGYTKAVKGGGSKTITSESGGSSRQTSSDGGASTQTSSSGGGQTQTSSSGGGVSQTSGAGGDHTHLMFRAIRYVNHDWGSEKVANVYHAKNGNSIYVAGGGLSDLETAGGSSNHVHSININPHSHTLTVENHRHTVNIPNHRHTVDIPAHKHEVQLPEHTHPLEWGIFQASDSASKVDIIVDGTTLPDHDTSQSRLNIVNYLKKTSAGKIQRGNHTIQIKPDKLARIEAQVTCRVFIQSQLGGQF